jgi:hypothetical protein
MASSPFRTLGCAGSKREVMRIRNEGFVALG